jgi:hypothetical protein
MTIISTKKVWGPKAWNLLHSFSINNNNKIPSNKKHNYYIFFTSFIYILPCDICSSHYSDIIYNINILEECKINRLYLIRWCYKTHNIVNKRLGKPKYLYNDFTNSHKNLENYVLHKDIFYILFYTLKNIDYSKISLYKYDQIYNFFINFCILYPDIIKRKHLKNIVKSVSFKEIKTPLQFKKWFFDNIIKIKNIIY